MGAAGDVATFDDTGADAPTITPGATSATDGTSSTQVTLSVGGESATNGTTHTYKVVASNATGNSADSGTNTGYRGTTTLTYQAYRSAGDSDADYSSIGGATTDPYNDTGAPAPTINGGTADATDGTYNDKVIASLSGHSASNGAGRYFKYQISMSGAASQYTSVDRGYRGTTTLTLQLQRSAGDSDASYSNIGGATTNPYNDTAAPAATITAGSADATDGAYADKVTLTNTGESVANGAGRYYRYVVSMSGASDANSAVNRGYRGNTGCTIAYQWQRSSGDYDADYGDCAGLTTNPDDDESPAAGGVWTGGRYYRCKLTSAGLTTVYSVANRGFAGLTDDFPGSGSLFVGVAWDDDWNTTSPTWYNISDDVREIHLVRGRNTDIDRTDAGTLDIVVNNSNGDYSPTNAGGDYAPNVDLRKRIQIKSYYDGTAYAEWNGYIDEFTSGYLGSGGMGEIMTIRAVGTLAIVAQKYITDGVGYSQEDSGTRFSNVLQDTGMDVSWITTETGNETIIASGVLSNTNARELLEELTQAEDSLIVENSDVGLNYEKREHRLIPPHNVPLVIFGTGGIEYSNITYIDNPLLIYNDIQFTREGGALQRQENASSQSKYGYRLLNRTNLQLTNDYVTNIQSIRFMMKYSTPKGRIEIEITPNTIDKWTVCLSLNISDRVKVINESLGINGDYFIEKIQHDWSFETGNYKTIFTLSNVNWNYTEEAPAEEILRPNAVGSTSELSPGGDTPNYKCVDEEVADEATTWCQK